MTAKSEMVCYRLLSLDGKGRLIVMGYACLWQNAPAQVLVNLSVPTYTTAPLRTKQKYVYKRWKLHAYKITRYTNKLDLYPIVYQRLTNAFLKGALLHVKRAPFTLQKGVFHTSKEHLLLCKRASFTVSKSTYYFQFMNLYYNLSNALFFFITSKYFSPCIIITTP